MSADRLINIEAEAHLLGALMQSNEDIDFTADLLDSTDFAEPVHARIFSAILREAALGKPATPVTLRGYFEEDPAMGELGGISYLPRMTSIASISARHLAPQVHDLAQRRRMRDGLLAAAAACADLESTTAEIISHADGALEVTGKEQIHQPTAGQCADELIKGFDEGDYGVTCNIVPELDRVLGRLRPKEFIIGAGRPGMGKTAVALSYALGAAQEGHGVLFVSLEMSSRDLGGRMISDLCFKDDSGIPYSAIRDGRLNEWQHRQVVRAGSFLHGLPIQVVDVGQLTTGRLNMLVRRHARRMAARGNKLELVIVDYLQLLRPDRRGSKYEDVSEISMSLKAMAKDQDVAVMALAQLSRKVEERPDKRPMLSDLRDSGQIEQDADTIFFLLREEYYLGQSEPDEFSPKRPAWESAMESMRGKIEFIVPKRRGGVTGKAFGTFHSAFQAVR